MVRGDDVANLVSPATQLWLLFAVPAGGLFGAAGAWTRSGHRWLGPIGTALAGAVLFAEALVRFHDRGNADAGSRSNISWTAIITIGLGVIAVLCIGRDARQRALGAAISLPLALLGAGAFLVVGHS